MPKKYFCGPYYIPERAKKPFSWVFNNSCKIHDLAYQKKGVNRFIIDFNFLLNMLVELFILLRQLFHLFIKFAAGCIMCPIFYVLVVFFGWISYCKKESKKARID